MRIEIKSGGSGGAASINGFQNDMSGFIRSTGSMIESFKTIKRETYELSGGVGNLQGALDNIDARIRKEETKKADAVSVQKKSNDFLDLSVRVDKQVSTLVNQNKDEFYRVNPWLKPATAEEEKPWYEQAWNWLCGAGEAIADGLQQAWDWVKDTASKAWAGLVDFYKIHKLDIINWGVTILCVVGSILAIALIPVTGGASIALIAGVSALSGAIIAGTRNVTSQYAQNGSFDNFSWKSLGKDMLIAAIVGGVSGAIGAGLGGAISGGLANTGIGASFLNSSSTIVRMASGALIGGISETSSGMVTRGVATATESFLSTGSVNYSDVWNASTDTKSIFLDLVIGSASGGFSAQRNPIGKEIDLIDLDSEMMNSKPLYSRDPKEWLTEMNGKIFVDGNGVWTYQAADGTHVCYSDGFPDFRRAGLVKTEYTVSGGFNTTNHNVDINQAINSTGLGGKGSKFTWHHYQDGSTLQLIDTEHHQLFRHIGGFSIAKGQ